MASCSSVGIGVLLNDWRDARDGRGIGRYDTGRPSQCRVPVPYPRRGAGSATSRTIILPVFFPSSSPMNAAGADSMPS